MNSPNLDCFSKVAYKAAKDRSDIFLDISLLLNESNTPSWANFEDLTDNFNSLSLKDKAKFLSHVQVSNWLIVLRDYLIEYFENNVFKMCEHEFISGLLIMKLYMSSLTNNNLIISPYTSLENQSLIIPRSSKAIKFPNTFTEAPTYFPKLSSIKVNGKMKFLGDCGDVSGICIVSKELNLFEYPNEYHNGFTEQISVNDWVLKLKSSIKLLETHRESYSLVSSFVFFIAPLVKTEPVKNLSFSAKRYPNTVFMTYDESEYIFAETLIHEADHHMFYALEEQNPFWASELEATLESYFSPWRGDPRPLDGLLRGLSALSRVSSFYSYVFNQCPKEKLEDLGKHTILRIEQCYEAYRTIIKSNLLSNYGKEFTKSILGSLNSSSKLMTGHPHYTSWKANALENISNHKTAFKRDKSYLE